MTYTSEGLVKHVKSVLALPTKYMWGGTLKIITNDYINKVVDFYKKVPSSTTGYTSNRVAELKKYAGKAYYGVDCICLVKSYYWSGKADGGVGSPAYDGKTDVNATTMFNAAKVKGHISTMPDTPGIIVFSKSHPHVGVYIGNGETIESTLGSRGDGVVKRKLDSFWEYWFECPYISYSHHNSIMVDATMKKVTLAFPARVRSKPTKDGKDLGRLEPGSTVTIVKNAEIKDPTTGYTYVRIAGDESKWIVKSAIKGA